MITSDLSECCLFVL